jgi:transposase
MYLRTTKRKNKDGSEVTYFQLAHNERHPETKVSTARVIHNFGRTDQLNRNELVKLCQSIARVCGVVVIDPGQEEESTREQAGLPGGIEFLRTVELGTPLVVENLWERLGIGPTLRKLLKKYGYRSPYERALLAMTMNRLCEPQSKLGVWDRWLEKVYLPSFEGLKLDQMYAAMDFFHKHQEKIERDVFLKQRSLMNLNVDVVFYDTTTASFSIDGEDGDPQEQGEDEGDGPLRKFGHTKEGGWAAQVVVALAVTREGLPIRSWVFPGNTADVKTMERVREDLRGWKLDKVLFTADSGMNSAEVREEFAQSGGKYLFATRMASVKEIKTGVLSKRGRFKVISENLHAKEVIIGKGEGQRRYVLCYNPHEANRQKLHREQVIRELEEKLCIHKDKSSTARWVNELRSSGRYGKYLKFSAAQNLQIDREAVRRAARYDGKWVIQTNDESLSFEDAACGYKALLVIERCFRSLKRTQVELTPMYHWLSRRLEIHVKICVLALLIERVAELHCKEPWSRIREKLLGLQASEYRSQNFNFFQRNKANPNLTKTMENLGIPLPKLVLGVSEQN